jgi:hypothetical protein
MDRIGLVFRAENEQRTEHEHEHEQPSPRYPQGNGRKTEEKISHETQGDRLNV